MKRPVRWSRDALDNLKNQIAYIASDNPAASRRIAVRIRTAAAALGDLATGRPSRVAGVYEKIVSGLPYIIAYEITPYSGGEAIFVLRVIHAARDWQPGEWPE